MSAEGTIIGGELSPDSAAPVAPAMIYRAIRIGLRRDMYAEKVAREPGLAADFMRTQAVRGEPAAQVAWGHALLRGHGVERDAEAALRWFQIAAKAGSSDGANMAGRCHELGWGTMTDLSSAVVCYEMAAAGGHAWAQFNLACLVLRGEAEGGIPRALSLLVRSARKRNAKAMNMIGRAREEGWTGRTHAASARRWYFRAARGGCFRGQYHTARFLLADRHVDAAVDWLHKSIAGAPSDFCADIGRMFAQHPDARLLRVAEVAQERGRAGAGADAEADAQFTGAERAARRGRPALRRLMRVWRTASSQRR